MNLFEHMTPCTLYPMSYMNPVWNMMNWL